MKKVLLASTALVATSSFATAQGVELSGYAEMGLIDGSSFSNVEFFHDFDVKFSLSGETDNGLTFGATIDLDEIGDDASCAGIAAIPDGTSTCTSVEEHSVFISGSFGTLTMGDTDGAFDFAMSEVGGLTAIADDHTTHAGYSGNGGLDGANDGQILRYDYSFGDIVFAVSAELDDLDAFSGDVIGVGARWSTDLGGTDLAVALAYQENDVVDMTGVSVRAGFGDFTAVLNYTDASTGADHTAVGVTYSAGAISVHANYGEFDGGADGFGVALNYDLGGGAVAMIGYGDDSTGFDQWSAGIGMSF
ncbi:MAG: porin [Boseongicola sp.]